MIMTSRYFNSCSVVLQRLTKSAFESHIHCSFINASFINTFHIFSCHSVSLLQKNISLVPFSGAEMMTKLRLNVYFPFHSEKVHNCEESHTLFCFESGQRPRTGWRIGGAYAGVSCSDTIHVHYSCGTVMLQLEGCQNPPTASIQTVYVTLSAWSLRPV